MILTFGQIEAITEFFEGKHDPDVDVHLVETSDGKGNVFFTIGDSFYKFRRVAPTKWLVVSADPHETIRKVTP